MADILLCSLISDPLNYPDNVVGTCDTCGAAIQYRPHAPVVKRMCVTCCAPLINEETQFEVTEETMDDVRAYLAKNPAN